MITFFLIAVLLVTFFTTLKEFTGQNNKRRQQAGKFCLIAMCMCFAIAIRTSAGDWAILGFTFFILVGLLKVLGEISDNPEMPVTSERDSGDESFEKNPTPTSQLILKVLETNPDYKKGLTFAWWISIGAIAFYSIKVLITGERLDIEWASLAIITSAILIFLTGSDELRKKLANGIDQLQNFMEAPLRQKISKIKNSLWPKIFSRKEASDTEEKPNR